MVSDRTADPLDMPQIGLSVGEITECGEVWNVELATDTGDKYRFTDQVNVD